MVKIVLFVANGRLCLMPVKEGEAPMLPSNIETGSLDEMFHLLVAAILEGHSAGEPFKEVVGVDGKTKLSRGDELHYPFTASFGYEDFVASKEDVKTAYNDYRPCYTVMEVQSRVNVGLEVLLEAYILDGCPKEESTFSTYSRYLGVRYKYDEGRFFFWTSIKNICFQ
jgi:hypothetical protein